jgi:hypothetical protein
MTKGQPEATGKKPDDIEYNYETATACICADGGSSKRPEHKEAQLKTLQAKGNADDGEAKRYAAGKIKEG